MIVLMLLFGTGCSGGTRGSGGPGQIDVTGKLLSANTALPIDNVTIRDTLSGIETLSDSSGEFFLSLPFVGDTLVLELKSNSPDLILDTRVVISDVPRDARRIRVELVVDSDAGTVSAGEPEIETDTEAQGADTKKKKKPKTERLPPNKVNPADDTTKEPTTTPGSGSENPEASPEQTPLPVPLPTAEPALPEPTAEPAPEQEQPTQGPEQDAPGTGLPPSETATPTVAPTPVSPTPIAAKAIPELALWELNMLEWGEQHGSALVQQADGALDPVLAMTSYDAQRVFQNIAGYTDDDSWLGYADAAEAVYRDRYAAKYDGGVPGWMHYTHGLLVDYLATGDALSLKVLTQIAKNAAYAQDLLSGGQYA